MQRMETQVTGMQAKVTSERMCRRRGPAIARDRVVDALTRRELILSGLAASALAACGRSEAPVARTRTVTGSRGPVEVPVAPARVAALVGSADIDVLSLGFEPVFSGSYASGWVDIPDATVTSDLLPPDPEVVAATHPDLLVGWDWLVDDPAWAGLQAIAPAVTLPEDPATTWREVYLLLADALNRRADGERQLEAFDARVDAIAARIAAREPIAVAQIGVFEPGSFWWWTHDYPANEHLAAVGIEVQVPDEEVAGTSLERLSEVTAPVLIVSGDAGAIADVAATPLWATLPAVRAGKVITVDRAIWGGAGLIWANRMLDEIERLFL